MRRLGSAGEVGGERLHALVTDVVVAETEDGQVRQRPTGVPRSRFERLEDGGAPGDDDDAESAFLVCFL